MKTTRKLSSYVLLVGIMGLSIVGGVVAYQLYSASIKNQATTEQINAIKPLDGMINKTTVEGLMSRRVYSDYEMDSLVNAPTTIEATESAVMPTNTTTPTPIITTAPVAAESTAAANLQQ